MIGDLAAHLGVVAVASLAATALLLPASTRRSVAMLAALAFLPVLVLGDAWDAPLIRDLRDNGALPLLGIAAAASATVAAGAAAFRRWPAALPLTVIAVLPFRVPIESGGDQANLLVPLYLVIAAGAVAQALPGWQRNGAAWTRGVSLRRVLAAVIVLYALQSLYTEDLSNALQNTSFFLVPFSIMFVLLSEVRWDAWTLKATLAVVVGEGVVFALVGFYEYAVRELLWNDQVIRSNEFHTYFRVNSLFWDPNIFGRYLALVLIALAALILWAREPRTQVGAGAAAAVLWAGLFLSFSQSSFAALLVGLAVLAGLRWSVRWTATACAAALVAAVAVAIALDVSLEPESGEGRLNKDTGGRIDLIGGGLELAADRPLWGYGSGSFARTFREQEKGDRPDAVAASHTEPVTVAAEQGLPGIALYVLLLVIAFATLLSRIGPVAPGINGPARAPPPTPSAVARVILVAALAALVVHTLTYAAFLPDPITWALLAIGVALTPHRGP